MNCKICGAPLAPGEVFCKNCGASNISDDTNATIPIVEADVDSKESSKEALSKANSELAGNGNFLVVIGIIVGLLATAVVGYLIYSSLQESRKQNNNSNVILVNQQKYTVRYGEHNFMFDSNSTISVGEFLDINLVEGNAHIYVDSNNEISNYNVENIKKTFENSTEYKITDVTEKKYNEKDCLEANVDYTDSNKSKLLMCNIDGKYWVAEIGAVDKSAYPSDDIVSKFLNIIFSGKKVEEEKSELKVGKFEIVPVESKNTENE